METSAEHDVFISHTGQDVRAKNFASHLGEAFEGNNVQPFYDVWSIRGGDFWKSKIEDSVISCTIFVCILSPKYFFRYWCMHELDLAILAGLTIIPVFLECGPPKLDDKEFVRKFENDHKGNHKYNVTDEELQRWKENLLLLPEYQGIPHYEEAKDSEVKLKQEIVKTVLQRLGREQTVETVPVETVVAPTVIETPVRDWIEESSLQRQRQRHEEKVQFRFWMFILLIVAVVVGIAVTATYCFGFSEDVCTLEPNNENATSVKDFFK